MSSHIQKVAVLGAGVMGSQIAAHFANAGFTVLLFDLNDAAVGSIQRLAKLDPLPLAMPEFAQRLKPCNYQNDIALLKDCDLVIEAVAEDLSIKDQLYQQIAPHLKPSATLATNTSGLSITKLASVLPPALKPRFLGMHFFNPPRYLPLVELIPHAQTDSLITLELKDFLSRFLGKQVVSAHDTPNFIANRLGVFGLLMTLHHAARLNISFEMVDQLTGKLLGRPKSATLRTLDVVGLDIFAHVVATMQNDLPQDPWHAYFALPEWVNVLIQNKALGQKSGKGIYQKTDKGLLVLNPKAHEYEAVKKPHSKILKELKASKWQKLWPSLAARKEPEAQFLYAVFRDLFHYTAYHATSISDNVRDIDTAMRCGFAWSEGVFESWQAIGWQKVITLINEDIKSNKALAQVALPKWVTKIEGAYQNNKAYAPSSKTWIDPKPSARQPFPMLVGQVAPALDIVFENASAVIYTYPEPPRPAKQDKRAAEPTKPILVISFKTKLCTINQEVLVALNKAVELAEKKYLGLIIWQKDSENFSAGADLLTLATQFELGGVVALEAVLTQFQNTMLRIRYAKVPIVTAVRGYVFGGGCELMMHSHKTVAALESYIGLVEVGVGLIPGAGGTKEMALRASVSDNPEKNLQQYFKQIGMAEVAKSAYQGQAMGYLRADDIVVMNPYEILFMAQQAIKKMTEQAFEARKPEMFNAQGIPAYANIMAAITNLELGHFASEYDAIIAEKLAHVITGGGVDPSMVDEAWMLRLERQAFLSLVIDRRTQARVAQMMRTGKPLRN
jgi:3-hydroxyacyl-CoA dehydrogenase